MAIIALLRFSGIIPTIPWQDKTEEKKELNWGSLVLMTYCILAILSNTSLVEALAVATNPDIRVVMRGVFIIAIPVYLTLLWVLAKLLFKAIKRPTPTTSWPPTHPWPTRDLQVCDLAEPRKSFQSAGAFSFKTKSTTSNLRNNLLILS